MTRESDDPTLGSIKVFCLLGPGLVAFSLADVEQSPQRAAASRWRGTVPV